MGRSAWRAVMISGGESRGVSTCPLLRWVAPYSGRSIGFQFSDVDRSNGGGGPSPSPARLRSANPGLFCLRGAIFIVKCTPELIKVPLWLFVQPFPGDPGNTEITAADLELMRLFQWVD
jgi:hypothetical protein